MLSVTSLLQEPGKMEVEKAITRFLLFHGKIHGALTVHLFNSVNCSGTNGIRLLPSTAFKLRFPRSLVVARYTIVVFVTLDFSAGSNSVTFSSYR